ncbi:lipid-A-disaccharide synthase [bacterium]|jgi:lipid-A-disaccharide synthase|nr:lipid-A-disaccharide synthase [bacterium]
MPQKKEMPLKIMISAGEISGDRYGAQLVQELSKSNEDISFYGMGHRAMENSGVQLLANLSGQSTIGVLEPLLYLPKILKALQKMKAFLRKERPDVFIAIDFQGFNMMVCKEAKKLGIPVVYFISPQEWQWGTESGGKKVTECTDKILSIFKEEVPFYSKLGGDPVFIGHPMCDIAKSESIKDMFLKKENLDSSKDILALFPGSRAQEIKHVWPVIGQAAQELTERFPKLQMVLAVADVELIPKIKESFTPSSPLKFYEGSPYDLMKHTRLSLVTSGTVTLEHMLIGTPFIANFRFHPISYWIIKKLVGKKFFERVKFISLPNILAKRKIVPENIQDDCNVERLVSQAVNFLENEGEIVTLKSDYEEVKKSVYSVNVNKKAAEEILNLIKKGR